MIQLLDQNTLMLRQNPKSSAFETVLKQQYTLVVYLTLALRLKVLIKHIIWFTTSRAYLLLRILIKGNIFSVCKT